MSTFLIKQNDTRPKLVVPLLDKLGTAEQEPIDLTSAKSVKLIVRDASASDPTAPKIKAEMAFTDRANGIVTYAWEPKDTDTVGTFNMEYEITWGDDGIETVPNEGFDTLQVLPDLDN